MARSISISHVCPLPRVSARSIGGHGKTRSAEFLCFICDSTPPSGTATSVVMPIFSLQCHTSLLYAATPYVATLRRYTIPATIFTSPAVIYTSTANVQMKSRIALRNSSRLLLQLLRQLQN